MTLALISSRAAVLVRSCQISAESAAACGAAAKKHPSRVGRLDDKDVLIYAYMWHPPPNLLHHWSRTEQDGVLDSGWSLVCTRIDKNIVTDTVTDVFHTLTGTEWEQDEWYMLTYN